MFPAASRVAREQELLELCADCEWRMLPIARELLGPRRGLRPVWVRLRELGLLKVGGGRVWPIRRFAEAHERELSALA